MSQSVRFRILFLLRVVLIAILIQLLFVWLGLSSVVIAVTAPFCTLIVLFVSDWVDDHVSVKFV